jgi:hypothetical protein
MNGAARFPRLPRPNRNSYPAIGLQRLARGCRANCGSLTRSTASSCGCRPGRNSARCPAPNRIFTTPLSVSNADVALASVKDAQFHGLSIRHVCEPGESGHQNGRPPRSCVPTRKQCSGHQRKKRPFLFTQGRQAARASSPPARSSPGWLAFHRPAADSHRESHRPIRPR